MFWLYGAITILVGAAIWLWWIRRLDRFEPERLKDLLRIGLMGGAYAVVMALILGAPLHFVHSRILFFAIAGINEELAKSWATVSLLKKRGLVDEPVDVLVYALTVALGFALIENFLYFLPGRPLVPLVRNVFSLPAHLCFAMIWAVPLTPRFWGPTAKAKPYRWILPFIFLAGLVHGGSNLFILFVQGWPRLAWMALPLSVMALIGRYFLNRFSDLSPFKPLPVCPFCGRNGHPKGRPRCLQCGSPLTRTLFHACPSCAGPVPPAAKFCQHCGAVQIVGELPAL